MGNSLRGAGRLETLPSVFAGEETERHLRAGMRSATSAALPEKTVVGLRNLQCSRPVALSGRVAVAQVQGLPKGGGAGVRARGYEHPALPAPLL